MADLISRAAAIDALTYQNIEKNFDSVCDGEIYRTKRAAQRVIANVPAVDAVPVVRCKDCKHRDPEDKKCDYGGMEVQGLFFPRPDNWFCADGERRDEDGSAD